MDGPIYRSPDETAEYRLSQAERAGWKIMDSIEDEDVKTRLFAMLDEVPRD